MKRKDYGNIAHTIYALGAIGAVATLAAVLGLTVPTLLLPGGFYPEMERRL